MSWLSSRKVGLVQQGWGASLPGSQGSCADIASVRSKAVMHRGPVAWVSGQCQTEVSAVGDNGELSSPTEISSLGP